MTIEIDNAQTRNRPEDLNGVIMNNEWQPIDTAPKDGTEILIYTTGRHWRNGWSDEKDFGESNDKPVVMAACWQPWYGDEMEGWMPANLDEEYGRFYEATHWMPLPEPPVSRETLGE